MVNKQMYIGGKEKRSSFVVAASKYKSGSQAWRLILLLGYQSIVLDKHYNFGPGYLVKGEFFDIDSIILVFIAFETT